MSSQATTAIPKRGEHVGMAERSGRFEIVDVNTLMQTVNVKALDGSEHVTRNVAWSSLKPETRKA